MHLCPATRNFSLRVLLWTSCTLPLLFGCKGSVPDDLLVDAEPTALIFIKTTSTRTLNHAGIGAHNLYSLTPISPNGQVRQLTFLTEGAVADPEISFDGLKVIFSMRRSRGDHWHIFTMNVDGSNLKQLTDGDFDDFDPVFLPSGKILFTSDRANFVDEYNKAMCEVMYTMNADGSNIQRISFNLSDDFDPIVLRDGRIGYTRWEHHGNINRFPLFFTNPDGRATFLLFGPHNRNFFHPRELEDGNIVAVMSRRVNGDEGALVLLHLDRGSADPLQPGDYENLAPNIVSEKMLSGPPFPNGAFKYPFPLPDGRLVVSYAPGPFESHEDADYGLYVINRDGSGLTLLYNDPQTNEFDPVVVTPRPIPPVIPEQLAKGANGQSGVFICQDVYFRQSKDGQDRPNRELKEVKFVMVSEGLPIDPKDRQMISLTSFERKRILGLAPVYEDGSFAIRVPSNTPIAFHTLDSLGRAIVSKRNWIYVRPGENFEACTGCHGPRGKKSNPNPIAATKEPTDLVVPIEKREVIAFQNAIAPIIEAKCVSCHGGATPAANLDLSLQPAGTEGNDRYPVAYRNLLSSSRNPRLVVAPFSRRSFLADKLLGVGRAQGQGPHPKAPNALTPDELRKFLHWIDLGAQYR